MEYGTAISQNPDMYAPHLNRARLYYHAKQYKEAMADYERAIELRPEMGEIYYWRAICYYDLGKRTEALQDLDKAIALGYKEIHPGFYQALKGGK
jgi:tetratricopeptide (TPR) repeat protein